MSATLIAEARQELELTTYTTLNRLIKAETDPIRLEKLLALALRARPPARPPEKTPPTPPAPPPPPPVAAERTIPEFSLSALNGELLPPSAPNSNLGPHPSAPLYTPMTDDEFLKLSRQIGHAEAHRRRLIRAHLVREQQRPDDESP